MYANINATELSKMIHQKEIKPSEACAYYLAKMEKDHSAYHIFNSINEEAAIKRAEELDKMPITSETSPMFGIPVAVKDNICTADMPTTCSSKMLQNYRPVFDATAVARLREQGSLIIGKTNMDEFSLGLDSDHSFFGPAKNPFDENRSADGAAVSVAVGSVPLSLGSDTGGSVRHPASVCGLVGYKPTYGVISRLGFIQAASSLDQIGTFGRTVSDAVLLTSAICGHDPKDTLSDARFPLDFSQMGKFNVKGKKIGILKEYTRCEVMSAAKTYESLGAEVVYVSVPSLQYGQAVYDIILSAEASSSLAKFDGIRFGYRSEKDAEINSLYINSRSEGFGLAVKKWIIMGTYLLSADNINGYYKKAYVIREMIRTELKTAFTGCDAMILPAVNESSNIPATLAGLPAISIPFGKDNDGLPVNVQIVGKQFDDANLLGLAYALERETAANKTVIPSMETI